MSDYIEIEAALPAGEEEALAEALSRAEVLGAVLEPNGSKTFRVGVWLSAGDPMRVAAIRELLEVLDATSVRVREHQAEDWCAGWRDDLRAFPVGRRWWVDPHPDRPSPAPNGRIRLAVQPRAAFGSGTHESTRLVLIELEARGCRNLEVLDLGTGSGVLAVAADALGAAEVLAVDTDPIAAWEARFTVAGQPRPCRVRIVAGGLDCLVDASFDLVLCNMTVAELAPLIGDMVRVVAPGGVVVLSGILAAERAEVASMLVEHGLDAGAVRRLGDWISFATRRPAPAS